MCGRQEFAEARRRYQQAPQVLFSHKEPPLELAKTNAAVGDNIGYITFGEPAVICDVVMLVVRSDMAIGSPSQGSVTAM